MGYSRTLVTERNMTFIPYVFRKCFESIYGYGYRKTLNRSTRVRFYQALLSEITDLLSPRQTTAIKADRKYLLCQRMDRIFLCVRGPCYHECDSR